MSSPAPTSRAWSWVQAGHWAEIAGSFTPADAEEWLPCPVKCGPRAFVLRVRGESMFNPHGPSPSYLRTLPSDIDLRITLR